MKLSNSIDALEGSNVAWVNGYHAPAPLRSRVC